MKIRFIVMSLLGALLLFGSSAGATSIRTSTPYGVLSSSTGVTVTGIGTEWTVPMPGQTGFDLLLQISPTSPDLNDPIDITADFNATSFGTDGSPSIGVLDCADFATGNTAAVCGSDTGENLTSCDLSGITITGGNQTITIPGSCVTANETLYFDLESLSGISITPASVLATPEPSSLALLAIGLIPLAFVSRRRLAA